MLETFMKLSDTFLKLSETVLKQLRNCLKLYRTCLKLSESVLKLQETCWNYLRRVWLFWSISETLWVDVETFFGAAMKPFWTCFLAFCSGWMQQRGAPLVLATRTALKLMSLLQPFGPTESVWSTACASESESTPGRSTMISSECGWEAMPWMLVI